MNNILLEVNPFLYLNEILAPLVLIVWTLVLRGFLPHLRFRGNGPLHFMVQGMSILATTLVCRATYWDVFRPLRRVYFDLPAIEKSFEHSFTNGSLNLLAIVAGYLILVGLHRTLPPEEQRKRSPFTAPFYPDGIIFFRKRESFDET